MTLLRSILYLCIGVSLASPLSHLIERDDSDDPSLDGYLVFPQGLSTSCSDGQQLIIKTAFQDTMMLAGVRGRGATFLNPDWKGVDAGLAKTWFGTVDLDSSEYLHKSIERNLQRVSSPRWLYKQKDRPSFDRTVDVYCPTKDTPTYDKDGKPSCQTDIHVASTMDVSMGQNFANTMPILNVCPRWFTYADFLPVSRDYELNPGNRDYVKDLYKTKGAMLLHELFHHKYGFDAMGTFRNGLISPPADDRMITRKDLNATEPDHPGKAYGQSAAKYVAKKFGAKWSFTNVDNYVCFIIASYVKKTWGVEPQKDFTEWPGLPGVTARHLHVRQEEAGEEHDDPSVVFIPDDVGEIDPIKTLDYIVAAPMDDLYYDLMTMNAPFVQDTAAQPSCHMTGTAATQQTLSDQVVAFCTSPANYNVRLGCIDDTSIPMQTFKYSVITGLDNVAIGMSVSYDPAWQGSGERLWDEDHCIDKLWTALNGCDTDTRDAKHGGVVREGGYIYDLSVHSLDQPGDSGWVPTNRHAELGGCQAV